jgi:hypothetical protein
MLKPKRRFEGYNRVCGSSLSHIHKILFTLEENAIHQHSKPEDPSMEPNPHRIALAIDKPHRHH